ncbi:MAG: AMP-binding protein [Acidimicrobiia bacterium]|jgi:acyl-CoA synthetase (AMP-forming)/AMP-acid ligase II
MWELREVSAELRDRYRADGHWTDDTFASFLEREISAAPDLTFRVWSTTHPFTGTTGGLYEQSSRLAASLHRMGIGVGDVVAYQVPNWAESVSVICAGFRLGAVMVPIVHFYGAREVEFILRQSGARALVTVDRFGHVDHLANLAGYRDRVEMLEHVIVIPSGTPGPELPGAVSFTDLLDAAPLTGTPDIDPDAAAMIGYTSGTTAEPKGVLHTHRSLLFEVPQLSALAPDARPILNASPLAHMTGMLASFLLPVYRHHQIHLTDQWDPQEALRIILEADVSAGAGATIFLTSLLDAPGFGPEHARRIANVGLGGAPVPTAVAERAEAAGITVFRSYGSTEHPSITGCRTDEPREKRNRTDGHPMLGVEIRLVDDDAEVGPGVPGEILSRGPDLFAGYTDPELTARSVTPDGWYRTGDVGVLDDDGYLTITDRVSDIIIRGGANISAAEIEEALMTMPGIAECAVVAAPDERMGEHALAAIRLRTDAPAPDLAAVQAHLDSAGLPKQKWVEEVRILDEFPRTPSGKIRKFVLRDELRNA